VDFGFIRAEFVKSMNMLRAVQTARSMDRAAAPQVAVERWSEPIISGKTFRGGVSDPISGMADEHGNLFYDLLFDQFPQIFTYSN